MLTKRMLHIQQIIAQYVHLSDDCYCKKKSIRKIFQIDFLDELISKMKVNESRDKKSLSHVAVCHKYLIAEKKKNFNQHFYFNYI